MKELLELVLRRLPAYAGQWLSLLSEPKRFLARQDLAAKGALPDALVFLGVSLALAFIAQLPLLTGSPDPLTSLSVRATVTFLSLLLTVAVLQLCWRVVGGKGELKATFLLSCYIVGFSMLLFLAFLLAGEGLFRLLDPEGHRDFHQGELASFDGSAFRLYAALLIAGLTAASVWAWAVWGAYRRVHGVSQGRSAIAFLLFNTLGLAVLLIIVPIIFALQPTPVRTEKAVLPPELVGHWRAVSQNPPSLSVADYNFTATGYYTYAHSLVSVEGDCKIIRRRAGWGRVKIEESRMALVPQVSKADTQNMCSGETTEAHASKAEETYFYRVDRRPDGWSLCLEGRDGTLCLAPAPPLK